MKKLNEALDRQKSDHLEELKKQQDELQNLLQTAVDEARDAKKLAEHNATEILRLKSTIDTLVDVNKSQAS